MKAYGLSRRDAGDIDAAGAASNGRASATHNIPGRGEDIREYRSLRKGKRAAARRILKRGARREGAREIARGLGD